MPTAAQSLPRSLLLLATALSFSSGRGATSTTAAAVRVPAEPPTVGETAVAVAPHAAAPELFAAQQLSHYLSLVAGTAVPVLSPAAAMASGRPVIAVGAAASVAVGVASSHLDHSLLADDGFFCATATGYRSVALSGATRGNATAPRGTPPHPVFPVCALVPRVQGSSGAVATVHGAVCMARPR